MEAPASDTAAVADGAIAVLGPGGVGGFLAAALARAGARVVVVARASTAAEIEAEGLRVESVLLGDFVARPEVVTRLQQPVGALLVATKATGLEQALTRVAASPALVVPLLNGLDHLALLRARFGERAVAGTIRVEADRPAPGRIVQTSPVARIELASDDRARRPALEALAARLEAAGIPVRIVASEAECLWSKLVRLNTLACMTTARDLPLGAIRDDPALRAELERCVAETAAVARAEGAPIDAAATLAELEQAHPGLGSSMRRDVAAGRMPELDAIAGAVLRAGARHGLACPTVAALAQAIAVRAGVPVPAA
jgi:2-dehydropantoate 2-reductase